MAITAPIAQLMQVSCLVGKEGANAIVQRFEKEGANMHDARATRPNDTVRVVWPSAPCHHGVVRVRSANAASPVALPVVKAPNAITGVAATSGTASPRSPWKICAPLSAMA